VGSVQIRVDVHIALALQYRVFQELTDDHHSSFVFDTNFLHHRNAVNKSKENNLPISANTNMSSLPTNTIEKTELL